MAEPDAATRDSLVAQFINITGADVEEANTWLSNCKWDIETAVVNYDHAQSSYSEQADDDDANPSGGRTLGDSGPSRAAQSTSSSSQPSGSSKNQKKIATLGDFASAPQVSDDDSDDDQDFFAGGEKSGLAVQNPDDLKKKIIEKARRGAPRPGGEDPQPQRSNFRGPAQTLGGDDAPSQKIEAEENQEDSPPERVERRLHFWSNGFSVDDGELYDTNDPANAEVLKMIRSGRAPLHIMNVRQDQEVDVKVEPHDGPYVPPKKKYKPFAGQGQRLGSPTPGPSSSSSSSARAPVTTSSTTISSSAPAVELDSSQPAVSLQIRLRDGSRLVSRFNLTHTIGDVYSFVRASSTASSEQNWVLMTTFPNKELTDQSAAIGDTAELKKGGTVVQKWT